MAARSEGAIPKYFLYGDGESEPELDFLHIEPIPKRSGAHSWTIGAHSHPDHLQLLLVERGGGALRVETRAFAVEPPVFLVIPAAMVHEIDFHPGTDGHVITAAIGYGRSAAGDDAHARDALTGLGAFPLLPGAPTSDLLRDAVAGIAREYVWSAPGRRMAILAEFQRILVAMTRLRAEQGVPDAMSSDRDYAIFHRYREEIERHYRSEKGLEFYAAQLGVTPQRLNLACKARGGRTASEILHDRVLIEAKRYLIHRAHTVAEIGYLLGYEDPAYFSRFFSQRVGMPPGAYRAARAASAGATTGAG